MNVYGFRLPEDFLIGTANSAFQSEGAWHADGKSESLMEHYAVEFAGKPSPHAKPGALPNSRDVGENGCFFYDNYEAYIEDMRKTGQNTFRMSLAWPRIIPDGVGAVNPLAIDHYNKVIDKLLECGIEPLVDLYHWDMPYCLFENGGFANEKFPEWFENYARVCFEHFGDRVKLWSTFNEAQVAVGSGLRLGSFPPFEKDIRLAMKSSINLILAHFRAVRLYKSMHLGGKIGSVNAFVNVTPMKNNEEDLAAVERCIENYFGWWVQPMLRGSFPEVLLRECPQFRENLPENYQQEFDRWFIPMDFIGVNYYTTKGATVKPGTLTGVTMAESFYSAPGQFFSSYPSGLLDVIQYLSDVYPGVDIYITENGCATKNTCNEEVELHDAERITYIREHLRVVARAIRAGYPVKGYYYWNDADSYEEMSGYDLTFGLTWVDRKTGRREWKDSRYYFSTICKSRMID